MNNRLGTTLVLGCLLVLLSPAVVSAAGATVTGFGITSEHVVKNVNGTSFVRASSNSDLRLRLSDTAESTPYEVCVTVTDSAADGEPTTEECQNVRFESNGTHTTTVPLPLSNESSGRQSVTVELQRLASAETLDTATTSVYVLRDGGDYDNDTLSNGAEFRAGTDFDSSDTDRDGLRDGREVKDLETDPLDADTDDDGVRDSQEFTLGTDPLDADTDGDGMEDGMELRIGTDPTVADTDSDDDGLTNSREVALGTDPLDADTDGDGLEDGFEVQYGTGPKSPLLVWVLIGTFFLTASLTVSLYVLRHWTDRDISPASRIRSDPARDADGSTVDTTPEPVEYDQSMVLTDEERIIELLEENGGRMPQQAFTAELDWSKSKVSRVLSRLEEDGELIKLSMGRENLIVADDGTDPTLSLLHPDDSTSADSADTANDSPSRDR